MSLSDRIETVEKRIQEACGRSGRSREEVQVIAVTKYVSADTALKAVELGLHHLGENRWQVAQDKWKAISGAVPEGADNPVVWHFIGSLQSNKVKEVIGKFTYIHSLDRLSLAKEIQKQAEQHGLVVPCFIQVNVSGEESKHGLQPDQVLPFLRDLRQLNAVRPVGLMTMAPLEAEAEATRPVFRALRQLRDELNRSGELDFPLTELSMGMSGDFEVAIEEGATWVRLGTILVGKEEE
ncbi:YggS family pyridoxal phosphate-dependent enzyme [Paenibacillus protaetiae]|uniref:Pyridoxal phosphate homeostasis protein n=1 Tax=Paenibacillus protaetiae TaxID=2509456 RepID=A0A4P6ER15_9BACL|nr:YggS family pyridoxal phosphate-dependent enzyme [Paenibacillus protaetiae]QAY65430.1 YggS family pyridoxal phosphate-dependent enzyme [Paenibacillus protaetiae]